MKISNIRLGFANNSSSSHSIIFISDSKLTELREDEKLKMSCFEGETVDGRFGWEYEYYGHPTDKARYFMSSYYDALPKTLTCRQKQAIMKEIFGIIKIDGEIDYQLENIIPINTADEEIVEKVFDFVVNNKAVQIVTGNDNGDDRYVGIDAISIPRREGIHFWPGGGKHGNIVTKVENENYVLFNTKTGGKTRTYLGTNPNPVPYAKAIVPELVDLKISDRCNTNCNFCYMGSTENGIDGEWKFIKCVLKDLSELGVFEVAIGGGEPIIYPYFKDVIEGNFESSWKKTNMRINFTTFDMSWYDRDFIWPKDWNIKRDKNDWRNNLRNVGSFAISNVSKDNLKKLIDYNKNAVEKNYPLGSIQIIEGVQSKAGIDKMLNFISSQFKDEDGDFDCENKAIPRITLLGYKTTGRGSEFEGKKVKSDWVSELLKGIVVWKNDYSKFKWAVDTQLVKNYGDELKNYPAEMYHRDEGKFSCFIDGVTQMVYPSSYEKTNGFKYTTKEEFISNFARF